MFAVFLWAVGKSWNLYFFVCLMLVHQRTECYCSRAHLFSIEVSFQIRPLLSGTKNVAQTFPSNQNKVWLAFAKTRLSLLCFFPLISQLFTRNVHVEELMQTAFIFCSLAINWTLIHKFVWKSHVGHWRRGSQIVTWLQADSRSDVADSGSQAQFPSAMWNHLRSSCRQRAHDLSQTHLLWAQTQH